MDEDNYNFIKNIPAGNSPVGIDINEKRNLVYVTNYASNSLSLINGTNGTVIKTIQTGQFPVGVKINPLSNKVYVSNIGSNTVSVINETSLEKIKDIPGKPLLNYRKRRISFHNSHKHKIPLDCKFCGNRPHY